jgi:MFS family permease
MKFSLLKLKLRALNSRNYRLFFFGQGTSLIGTWMNNVAAIWAVYHLTDSPLLLGVFGFLSQSPAMLAPLAGSYVDRWNHRQILLITQAISMVQSLILAYLALTQSLNIVNLIILSFIQGIINALDVPTRQAFLPEMVDSKADLDKRRKAVL